MSVLVIGKFRGDTETFRRAVAERADDFAEVAQRGRADGCLHHRFGVGDGVVFAVDEWEAAAHFEKFFSTPEMQAFITSVGADPTVAPEISVTDAIASADQF